MQYLSESEQQFWMHLLYQASDHLDMIGGLVFCAVLYVWSKWPVRQERPSN